MANIPLEGVWYMRKEKREGGERVFPHGWMGDSTLGRRRGRRRDCGC